MNTKFLYIIIVVLASYNVRSQKILKPIWTNTFVGRYSEFSTDSKRILTKSTGVTIFSTETKQALASLTDVKGFIVEAHFDKTGRYVVTGSEDTIRVWNVETAQQIVSFADGRHSLFFVGFDSSGAKVISNSKDNICNVWDAHSGEHLGVIQTNCFGIKQIEINYERNWLLVVSINDKVNICSIETGEVLYSFQFPDSDISKAVLSKNGDKLIALGKYDKTVVWEVSSGKILYEFEGKGSTIWDETKEKRGISIDEKGEKAAIISYDTIIQIRNLTTGKELQSFKGHSKRVSSVIFNKQSDRLLTLSDDGTCKLWDINSGTSLTTIKPEHGSIMHANFSTNGELFSISYSIGNCDVWQTDKVEMVYSLKGENVVRSTRVSQSGEAVFTTNYFGALTRWDTRTGESKKITPYRDIVKSFVICDNDKLLITVGDSAAKVWTKDSLTFVKNLIDRKSLGDIYVTKRDTLVLISNDNNGQELWNTVTCLKVQELSSGGMFGVSSITDGNEYLILTSMFHYLYRYSNGKYTALGPIKWAGITQQVLLIEGEERIIVVEEKLPVWSLSSSTWVGNVTDSILEPRRALLTKDGQKIVVSYSDGEIRLWSLKEKGTPIYTINESQKSKGYTPIILSKDGSKILSVNGYYENKIWDTETGELLAILSGQGGSIDFMEFINNDTQLFTCSRDGGANLWDVGNLHPSTVSENRDSKSNNVSIFPNPASDKITIRMPEEIQGTAQYTITDQIGKIIERGNLSVGNEQHVLSLGNISAGLYRIMIEANQTNYSESLIIYQ